MDVSKTSIIASGVVWAVSEYISKEKKSYFSVDLLIKDHKNMVNIKLPENYDKSILKVGQNVVIQIKVSSYNSNLYLTAI